LSYIDDIYKLNVSDPLKYKWSLLAKFDYRDNSVKDTASSAFSVNSSFTPIQTEASAVSNSSSFYENTSRKRTVIIIIFVIIILICISILFYYKKKQKKQEIKQ
jgi:hypothetical protein